MFDIGATLLSHHWAGNAHQREVKDLSAAGLNPMLGMSGMGAPMPDVSSFGSRASAGLNAGMSLSTLESRKRLINNQANAAAENARRASSEADALAALTPFRLALLQGEVKVTDLTAATKANLLPWLVLEMKTRISQMASSAQSLSAMAVIHEYEQTGKLNVQKFEQQLGIFGPMAGFALEMAKGIGGLF